VKERSVAPAPDAPELATEPPVEGTEDAPPQPGHRESAGRDVEHPGEFVRDVLVGPGVAHEPAHEGEDNGEEQDSSPPFPPPRRLRGRLVAGHGHLLRVGFSIYPSFLL